MKNKMNIFRRLKVCWVYFRTLDTNFLGEYCPFCKSHRIKSINLLDIFCEKDNTHIYTAKYECQECGAIADTKEVWLLKQ